MACSCSTEGFLSAFLRAVKPLSWFQVSMRLWFKYGVRDGWFLAYRCLICPFREYVLRTAHKVPQAACELYVVYVGL